MMSSPSSSPRWDSHWDNRNSGFVSPSQLQHWKQQQALAQQQREEQQRLLQQQQQQQQQRQDEASTSSAPLPQPSQEPQPSMFRTTSRPEPAMSPAAPTHSRTTSAFSFFKRPTHHSTSSTNSVKEPARQSSTAPNEFGQHQPTTTTSGPPQLSLGSLGDKSPPPLPPGQSGQASNFSPPQRLSPDNAERSQLPSNSSPDGPSSSHGQEAPLPPLHPEIRSVVQLIQAHGQKIYYSGPLIRHTERLADGQRPAKEDDWHNVWAQLGGTTLSLWDMKEIEEASKQGKQVPPSYVNITDAFQQVLGSVTIPATPNAPAKKYTNVLTLNNAGSNLYLFAAPNTQALLSWTAALRLAAWEKSRLEEIYTAHLIRITHNDGRDTPTPLVQGKLEGWVRIRVAGQTDWKRFWMVVAAGHNLTENGSTSSVDPGTPSVLRKKRISSLFGGSRDDPPVLRLAPQRPIIQLFQSNKHKDKKKAQLIVRDVKQAFAVYPERPEFISRSTLFKLEGLLGDEDLAGTFKNREGWLLVMPELEGLNTRASEMLKWLVAIHDAFELYGRPRMYSWDPRDPRSMMFAYPIGPSKDLLFLDRELAENLDPRDDRTSSTRSQLLHIMWDRMRGSPEQSQSQSPPNSARLDGPPVLPPLGEHSPERRTSPSPAGLSSLSQSMQIPPLSFETSRVDQDLPAVPARALTPITERSTDRNSRFSGAENINSSLHGGRSGPSPGIEQHTETHPTDTSKTIISGNILAIPLSSSPTQTSPTSLHTTNNIQPSAYPRAEHPDLRSASIDFSAGSGASVPKSEPKLTPPRQTTANSANYNNVGTTVNVSRFSDAGRQSPASMVQEQKSVVVSRSSISAPQTLSPPASPGPASLRSSLESPAAPLPPRFSALNAEAQPPMSPRFAALNVTQSQESQPPPSPRFSVLSSPHSIQETSQQLSSPRFSVLSSPYSGEGSPTERHSRLSIALQDTSATAFAQPPTPRQLGHQAILPSPLVPHRDLSSNPPSRVEPIPSPSPQFEATIPAPSPLPIAAPPSTAARKVKSPSLPPTTPPLSSPKPQAVAPCTNIRNASPAPGPSPPPPPKDNTAPEISREAGALYYMRNASQTSQPRRQLPSPGGDHMSESESGSAYSPQPAANSPSTTHSANSPSPGLGTSGGYFSPRTSVTYNNPPFGQPQFSHGADVPPQSAFSHRASNMPPNRKPSGARAAPANKTFTAQRDQHPQQPPLPPTIDGDEPKDQEDDMSDEQYSEELAAGPRQLPPRMAAVAAARHNDADAADALAALSFLEREDQAEAPPPPSQSFSPPPSSSSQDVPEIVEPRTTSPPVSHEGSIRSSFAKSKQAAQRQAQSEAQKAAQQAAAHVPGRANGKGKKKARGTGAWGESSDEEEDDEEEDDDEDADSDDEPPPKQAPKVDQRSIGSPGQQGYPSPRSTSPMAPPPQDQNGYPASARRAPRDLPQLPAGPSQSQFGSGEYLSSQSQYGQDPYSDAGRRSLYPDAPRRQASPQTQVRQPEFNNVAAARQNMWSQALERDTSQAAPEPGRDTFLQIEPPSQTMTKAFAPHGLLSAGLQDKQDRSAKRQEELARESGASLINVPNKPPPPQTGLLGAVTAHERERKREGGLGAALTEREREKRVAEERQRKLDEFQRMQLDQMQQGGSVYGGMGMQPQFSGFNPMMGMNPMMMGMNPMMTGGYMGYPGMMNPQQMFAAQQAAQAAYQQAMYAFSTAGSQMGGDGGNPAAMNPMMTGNGMGMDPRMSMMGMGMMAPQMTGMGQGMMGPGMNPMGMGMGMMGMNPQMTGGSMFDPRFNPGNEGLQPPNEAGGTSTPYSQNSSANGQGSPAGPRLVDGGEEPPRRAGAADVR
ncbi:hypothetical protein BDY19DRAFT_1055339 [Irpex rosettiformis]|uniref:Uncharacterized protein n=1 Tax=Irpex rosettiformis TaxID=378272 RepID=A0ACB8UAC9_9APHY|nr:hypothetical protein BDY19DRAFT_1055339 [Irpex rosettiformis]